MSKIKTGVVGVGSLGRHHLRWLSQLPQSELVGIYDIEQPKAIQYAAEYRITAFDSLDQMAQQVQAVSVAVPTTAHFEVATKLIKKGIHCLVEKPVTASVAEADNLGRLARENKVKVMVGQIERFNPAVMALKDFDIVPSFVEAHRLAAFDPRGTDVAVVLDLMIHDIDLVLSLVSSPIEDIQASGVAVVSEQIDIANARISFASGAVANLTASRISLRPMRKLRIFQKSGYFSLDLAAKQADIYRLAENGQPNSEGMRLPLGKSGKEIVYVKRGDTGQDMLGAELSVFLKAVIEDLPVAVSVEQGAEALRVALEIERISKARISSLGSSAPK